MAREALAILLMGVVVLILSKPATVGEYIAKARVGYVAEMLR